MMNRSNVSDEGELHITTRGKRAIIGAWVAFYVDLFDIYLPIVVLAPAIGYFVSQELSSGASAVVGGAIFAATLVGRPLGAAIFGHLADTIGRKRTTVISVTGFGVATLLMALLPGYQQWGVAVVIVFIALRLVDGIFLGGGYTAANPLAMEHSPKERRGFYSGIISTAFPAAYISISLITLILLSFMPSEGVNSAYVVWGWRIPFVVGAILAFGLAVYYSRSVSESELFRQATRTKAPLIQLLSGRNLKNFLQVFVLMSGLWLLAQAVAAILPALLQSPFGLSLPNLTATIVLACAFIALIIGYVAAGVISQFVGRRAFLIASGLVTGVAGTLVYYLLLSDITDNVVGITLLVATTIFLVVSPFGVSIAYITERFHIGVRASGYGLGYSLAVILPSLYAFYQQGLSTFMPFRYTVLVLVVVGALLTVIGAAWGPETKEIDFAIKLE